jgi:hypothetical protein
LAAEGWIVVVFVGVNRMELAEIEVDMNWGTKNS